MISRWESRWRRLRRWASRSEWMVRLLDLQRSAGTADHSGLVLLQIDGLARGQLEQAIDAGRMPFLKRLLLRERHILRPMYSGFPSSTPAMQGELFYGVKGAVPAFAFRQHESGRVVQMNDCDPAQLVEHKLKSAGERPLLAGGSAYCDIYAAGAAEAHCCAVTMGWGELTKDIRIWKWVWILFWYAPAVARLVGLALLELVLGIADALRGARRYPWSHELKFIGNRIVVSIGMRELATIGGSLDISRGLPIVHANFLGYDEHAHRRGPGSRFAHRSLKGIDNAIRRLWKAAHSSAHRDYEVWIYSDHGQETTVPYEEHAGQTIEAAVSKLLNEVTGEPTDNKPLAVDQQSGRASGRAQWLRRRLRGVPPNSEAGDSAADDSPLVVAMGPLGYLYPRKPLDDEQCAGLARRLVTEAQVPLVIWPTAAGEVMACSAHTDMVPFVERAAVLLGAEHPYLTELAADVTKVCRHPDAGRMTISGWRPNEPPISFVPEQGGHAGPGMAETDAFLIAPADAPLPPDREVMRPTTLRRAVFDKLAGAPHVASSHAVVHPRAPETLRVVTYNVHSCVGMDAKHSPQRVARVIAQCQPDVVALQELDVGRVRTQTRDQAREIARTLRMDYEFFPALGEGSEMYGDAVLSHLPMRLVRAATLPPHTPGRRVEPRGALWVAVSVVGHEVQLINTHLGLSRDERLRQVEALLGPDWLAHGDCRSPTILCGDLNALPNSTAYRLLTRRLSDAQRSLSGHRPRGTFFGRMPLGRIDHVFVDDGLEVLNVEVVRTQLARVASDHLPLVVDLRIPIH